MLQFSQVWSIWSTKHFREINRSLRRQVLLSLNVPPVLCCIRNQWIELLQCLSLRSKRSRTMGVLFYRILARAQTAARAKQQRSRAGMAQWSNCFWKLGRVERLITGKGGLVHGAVVKSMTPMPRRGNRQCWDLHCKTWEYSNSSLRCACQDNGS